MDAEGPTETLVQPAVHPPSPIMITALAWSWCCHSPSPQRLRALPNSGNVWEPLPYLEEASLPAHNVAHRDRYIKAGKLDRIWPYLGNLESHLCVTSFFIFIQNSHHTIIFFKQLHHGTFNECCTERKQMEKKGTEILQFAFHSVLTVK